MNVVAILGLAMIQILNLYVMIVARVILGYVAGAMAVVGTRFISEITPARLRASSVALISFQVTGSLFVGFLVGHLLVPYNEDENFSTSESW